MNKKLMIKIFASVFACADLIAMNIPIDDSPEAARLRNMHFGELSIREFKEINITMQDIEAMQKARLMTLHINELERIGFLKSDILNMIHNNALSISNCQKLLDIVDLYHAPFDILHQLLERKTLIDDKLKYEIYRACLNDATITDNEIDEVIDKNFVLKQVYELIDIGVTSQQLLRLMREHNLQRNNYMKLIDGASRCPLGELLDDIYSNKIDIDRIEFPEMVVTDMTGFLREKQQEEREERQGMLINTISNTYKKKSVQKYIQYVTEYKSIEQTLLKKIFSFNDISTSSCVIVLDADTQFRWLDSLNSKASTNLNDCKLQTAENIVLLPQVDVKKILAEYSDVTNKKFADMFELSKYKPSCQRALHRGFNFVLSVLDLLSSSMPIQDESTQYILHFAPWFATLKSDSSISYVNFKNGKTTLQRLNVSN